MSDFKRIFAIFLIIISLVALLNITAAAEETPKLVALTFDDGPGKYTAKLLDGLAERDVKATFFMLGSLIERYPDEVKRMAEDGHQLANHSYSHANLTKLDADSVKWEIFETQRMLASYGGDRTYFVRPPYGSVNSTVKACVRAPLITWSVDPLDWKYRNTDKVTKNILSVVKDGDIILLHDIHETSVYAAFNTIDALKKDGWEFVTVEELFRRRGIEAETGKVYYRAAYSGYDLPGEYDGEFLLDHWAYKSISAAVDKKYIDLFPDGSFKPDAPMTRGAFAAALGRLYEASGRSVAVSDTVDFSDVTANSRYYKYVQWAASQKLIKGYGDGSFGYFDSITREQMAVIAMRYLQLFGKTFRTKDITYTDSGSIASWAKNGVAYCAEAGIIKGLEDGSFAPKKAMTRAHASAVIARLSALRKIH